MNKNVEKINQEGALAEVKRLLEGNKITPERLILIVRRELADSLILQAEGSRLPSTTGELEKLVCVLAKKSVTYEKRLLVAISRLKDLRYAISSRLSEIQGVVNKKRIWQMSDGKKRAFASEVGKILEELIPIDDGSENKIGKVIEIMKRKYEDIENLEEEALEPALEREGETSGKETLTKSQFLNKDQHFVTDEGCNPYEREVEASQREAMALKRHIDRNEQRASQREHLINDLKKFIEDTVSEIRALFDVMYPSFAEMKDAVEKRVSLKIGQLNESFPTARDKSGPGKEVAIKPEDRSTHSWPNDNSSSRTNPEW